MRAMVLAAPRRAEEDPLAPADLPVPEPGPGELLLRVHACAVCHTDLHLAEGEVPAFRLPIVPGHQVVGVVDKVGPGAGHFHPGDRAGVPWLHWACGECWYCRQGRENLCDRGRFTGQHVDGGFAEYMVAADGFACRIPGSLADSQAAPLLCAGVIGYRSLRLCEVEHGGRLGLYGFGASAHLAIQVARYWGCDVYVFTRGSEHRNQAMELGAAWVGAADETPPHPLDAAITFAPVGSLVPHALRALRKGGTLAVNAIHMSPIPEMPYSLLYGERTLRSVANATRRDAEDLLALAAAIPLSAEVQSFPLEAANEVLRLLKRSEIRGSAVLQLSTS